MSDRGPFATSSPPRVHLFGGDRIGWAVDTDLAITRRTLAGAIEETALEDCQVLHAVWWEPLAALPPSSLAGKRVVCHITGEPFRILTEKRFRRVMDRVGCWIAQSNQAHRQIEALGLSVVRVPYALDTDRFRPMTDADADRTAALRQWKIPSGRFLIGSFHRDSEGRDLACPKRVKGPDILLEIVRALHARGLPIHVVLAGPRRHWLRDQLSRNGIGHTFVGEVTTEDDLDRNTLPAETIARLYPLLDLYLVSSRSEGGPRTLIEALAAGCPVMSRPVGLAAELLAPDALFHTPLEAVERIAAACTGDGPVPGAGLRETVVARHGLAAVSGRWREIYADWSALPRCNGPTVSPPRQRLWAAPFFFWRRRAPLRVGLWHRFFAPPYGGGNQFMLALRRALTERGVRVHCNPVRARVDVHVINAVHFDTEALRRLQGRRPLRVLHRIDGPIHLVRGHDREKDALCYRLNREMAAATVIQSRWTYQRILESGYRPVRPVILPNGVDPLIFHPHGRRPLQPDRRIRLIATSWSDNPRKGTPVYRWLEKRLDWSRFTFTFVGNAPMPFECIRHLPPVPSERLADLLRDHDIYITASRNDPCSNAVLEALACGLPVLYRNDGGHPELVDQGGLPFESREEILPQLDRLAAHHGLFQRLIVPRPIDEVADVYLGLLEEIAEAPPEPL